MTEEEKIEAMKTASVECPHCGHVEHDWKTGSAWSIEKPIGEYRCWSCGEWVKVVLGKYEPHAFKTWPQAELAAKLPEERSSRARSEENPHVDA